MNYGEVEEPSSSRSRRTTTARRSATSAILTVILSRSHRTSRASRTVNTWPAWGRPSARPDNDACGATHTARYWTIPAADHPPRARVRGGNSADLMRCESGADWSAGVRQGLVLHSYHPQPDCRVSTQCGGRRVV